MKYIVKIQKTLGFRSLNWHQSYIGKNFIVKLNCKKDIYEVINPSPKSFIPHDSFWIMKNEGTLLIPKEICTIIKTIKQK